MSDRLVEINFEFWPTLRDKYLKDWPYNSLGYDTVNNYINWKQKDPNFDDAHFYSLNGNWDDGTFIILDGWQIFAYTLNDSQNQLKKLLILLPKNKDFLLCGVEYRNLLAVYEAIEQKNWVIPAAETTTLKYRISMKEALTLELNIPDGLSLKPLSLENLEEINSVYPFRSDASTAAFKKLQKFNLNLGLYDTENKLLAWCLRYPSGLLNALQTQEKYRNRGFGSIVAKAMTIELAKAGEDCGATIVPTNISSIRLFKKLGFKYTGDLLTWIGFKTIEETKK